MNVEKLKALLISIYPSVAKSAPVGKFVSSDSPVRNSLTALGAGDDQTEKILAVSLVAGWLSRSIPVQCAGSPSRSGAHTRASANKQPARRTAGKRGVDTFDSSPKRQRCDQSQDHNDEEEDDDTERRRPKRQKPGSASPASPLLLACPFQKFDPERYSEINAQEKEHRGCSSGYWPDIARLK